MTFLVEHNSSWLDYNKFGEGSVDQKDYETIKSFHLIPWASMLISLHICFSVGFNFMLGMDMGNQISSMVFTCSYIVLVYF